MSNGFAIYIYAVWLNLPLFHRLTSEKFIVYTFCNPFGLMSVVI